MQPVTAAPTSAPSRRILRPAISEGAPLLIDPTEPQTFGEALQRTAQRYSDRGIRIVRANRPDYFLTYAALLRRAACVLGGLTKLGLAPGSKVILQLDSLEEHFAAFWACVLGGIIPVTVAIAPTYAERNGVVDKLYNTWQLLDRPPVITTQRLKLSLRNLSEVLSSPEIKVLCIENLRTSDPAAAFHNAKPEDVVFIQLSSGSTGVPKCIQETHSGIIAHIHSSAQFNGYSSDDVTFNWLPMDHVVPILTFHLKDIYLGCRQHHCPTQLVLSEPLLWLDAIAKHSVTHTWAPNFGFKLVTDRLAHVAGRRWNLSSVKFMMNAGEQVTMPVVRDFLQSVAPFGLKASAMQPAFGMAEVCTCMTYANGFSTDSGSRRFLKSSLSGELEPALDDGPDTAEFVSLGRVSPGISIRIADSSNRILPERHIGRFQIKGPTVTPGYFHNEEANRDAFVGDGWFNSGDLGFMENGELFLTGREKEMIIIRGAKYYCYEVEDVVNGIPGVEPTFVATCGTNDPETGTETLAVFFVPSGVTDDLAVIQAIRRRVTARLGIAPGFVVPLAKSDFPKTTSGKIQRTQLKKTLEAGAYRELLKDLVQRPDSNGAQTPTATDVEKQVAEIWRDVLRCADLPAQAHLFELGGDSLKATQIASRIRERWQTDFPLHLLFSEIGTISGMAKWISEHESSSAESAPPIHPAPRNAVLPLSYSQLRLWIADQIDPGTALYNITRVFTLKGPLNFPAVEQALHALVQRHEVLRTVYLITSSIPEQKILPTVQIPIPRHDLSHLNGDERQRVIENLLSMEAARPFNLASGPLIRTKLIRSSEQEHLLVVTMHQIVTDAWSLGVLTRELAEFYSCFVREDSTPDVLPIQYADYAVWQQRWLADAALEKQLAFWKEQLKGAPSPLTFSNSATAVSSESSVRQWMLPVALVKELREFNRDENVSNYMSLLTVYSLALAAWNNISELVIGSPESGRRRFETEILLGCFVNMLPLRIRLLPDDTFRSLLQRVRETTAQTFANADIPFEKIQSLAPVTGDTRQRLFQVWFGPIDSMQSFTADGIQAEVRPVFPPEAQFDLSCFVSERTDTITLYFEYKKAVFTSEQITSFVNQFQQLLQRMLAGPSTDISPKAKTPLELETPLRTL